MKKFLQILLWLVQGVIVGVGAILPGVSGGTLCYAFGIYSQLLEVLTSPIKGIKKNWFMLIFVGLGVGAGFIGFAGITASLLRWNAPVIICIFIGLILGTVPEIWREAGERGRNKYSIISMIASFVFVFALFFFAGNVLNIQIPAAWWGFAICGFAWGLSFIIPGFSTSTLLMFFGIYNKMSEGINAFDFKVIIPMGVAMALTILGLSKVMKYVFDKHYSIASHSVLGFVMATTVMLISASEDGSPTVIDTFRGWNIAIYIGCVVGGAIVGYLLTVACDKIKELADSKEEKST